MGNAPLAGEWVGGPLHQPNHASLDTQIESRRPGRHLETFLEHVTSCGFIFHKYEPMAGTIRVQNYKQEMHALCLTILFNATLTLNIMYGKRSILKFYAQ